jgi:hypothetical protein
MRNIFSHLVLKIKIINLTLFIGPIMVPTVQLTHSDAISTMNHHHGTYCSINTLRRYINHESSSWHLLFNEHTQTLYQPWIIIMVPTVQWTHSDAISTMNHHHGTYCSANTLRRYINHESSSWYLLFWEHTQTLYQPWIIIMCRYHDDDSWLI